MPKQNLCHDGQLTAREQASSPSSKVAVEDSLPLCAGPLLTHELKLKSEDSISSSGCDGLLAPKNFISLATALSQRWRLCELSSWTEESRQERHTGAQRAAYINAQISQL